MTLPELCIKRPVFATVMSLFLILLGLVSYSRLSVREYPNIDEPIVTVSTSYLGASAEIMESQVTKVLEDSLAGIEGIEIMSSISRSESSQITLRFVISRDPDAAANDVRDRVSRVRSQLPDEVDDPTVAKVEADAQPIIYLAFTSDRLSAMEITDYADRYVQDRLQNVEGVAQANIIGERRKSMRLWLDPLRLAAAKLTPADVETALRSQNVEIPAGRIESSQREFTVLSETDLRSAEQFESLILKRDGTTFVRLRDVGRAEVAAEDERRVVRFNGKNAVALGIVKQATSNPLTVSQGIQKLLPDIRSSLPEGMNIEIAHDTSVFIDRSIKAVYQTIVEAVVLVLIVIFFFLRSFRSTFIPLVTIPISLIGVCFAMYVMGYTINTLTLLAFVLAIGLVVDDAIVVLENIFRHIEEGKSPREASLIGGKEIAFAVIAMTITLAAVYAPIALSTGKTGKLFVEFALTLAGAVIISGFVALTLTPMLCSKMLSGHKEKHGRIYNAIETFLEKLTSGYGRLLGLALSWRFVIVIIGLAVAGANVALLMLIKSELAPIEDRGTIVVRASAPEGSTINYMTEWMKKLEPIAASVPEIDRYFVVAGSPTVSDGIAFLRMKPWEERERKQQDITKELTPRILQATAGISAFPRNPPSLGGSARSSPVQMVILTSGTYQDLDKAVTQLVQDFATYPGMVDVDTNLRMNKPQLNIKLDRDKTAAVDADIDDAGRTLETLLGGRQVTRYKDNGEQYDVIVQVSDDLRTRPQDLTDIYVRNQKNEMIKLSNLVTIEETVAPRELNHFNQLRAADITASLAPGYALGEVLTYADKRAKELLPPGFIVDYNGESREFKSSGASIVLTFALAIAFIYLVLSAQFESFVGPFIIMLSVPLSIAGALLALYLTGGTLNIYSQIGLVTLIGLITKHGILIVEFANQARESNDKLGRREAVTQASLMRLRPILMTTGAMVLGALPLALATGAGAESRQQIGWVIIGGMGIGTFFTLFIVPVVYSLLSRKDMPKHG
ncbi:MAG: multidrug efflux transporter, Acriflavin resistance protein [Alphaproteobacteria bacterium]|jgi:multidrug efflux pump|nr:multidrug efflux transporter, Acriflavin resistance protein [Alphaproteobacteria bacterium]